MAAMPVVGATVESAEEQTEFSVILKEVGDKRINVIKEVRAITQLGLKEAKDFIERYAKVLKMNKKNRK